MNDLPVDNLLSVDQAIAILDAVPLEARVITSPLDDALGHRLAEDIFSDGDYPPFDKALMDGFAVRSADATSAGIGLNVVDTIAAGIVGQRTIGTGETAAIMTGAPIPTGADAVIPIEQTARDGHRVTLHKSVKPNQSVAKRGSDTPAGKLLLEKGITLGPAHIGVAATVGKSSIAIYAAPSVALLATGDELVEIDQVPTGSQIRNSNIHMMRALLTKLGCSVRLLGIARDNRDLIRCAIRDGLRDDALFITGGMSMGERDYVPELLRELGMSLTISKLRIKPGKPFVFATGKHAIHPSGNPAMVFGLPGNPVSAFVCTIRLASGILSRLGGKNAPVIYEAIISNAIAENGLRETYLPAVLVGSTVEPLNSNGSADLFTLARASAFIIRPENAPAASAGDLVRIINLP
jgi:molybdopterin molybdotransferase